MNASIHRMGSHAQSQFAVGLCIRRCASGGHTALQLLLAAPWHPYEGHYGLSSHSHRTRQEPQQNVIRRNGYVEPEGHQYPDVCRPVQVDTVYPVADLWYPGAHGSAATEADGQYRPAGQAAAMYAVGDVDAAGQ